MTKDPTAYMRPNIRALAPYSTARDEFKGGDIHLWADANENPFDNGLNRYPDPHQKELKRAVANLMGVEEEMIFIGGAGSDEAIDLCCRIFCNPGRDNVVAVAPTYGVYRVAADINDVEYREVLLNDDFSLPVGRLLDAADANTKIIWIGSPNNPTGNAFPVEDILEVAERFDGIVVVDEAYADFSEKGSLLHEIGSHPNVIVLRTFSKAWGLASLRAGMAFAVPEVAAVFAKVKHPYNMNGPTQRQLIKLIEKGAPEVVPLIVSERDRLAKALAEIPAVEKVYPSDANFILVKVADANAMYGYLIDRGIIVRNRSTQKMCDGTLRITVGTPAQNDEIIEAIAEFGKDTPAAATAEQREGSVTRTTRETDIECTVNLDSNRGSHIDTGLKFFDHMLDQIPHHAGIGLQLTAKGDLQVDEHHTVEDVAIVLGKALDAALGDKRGIDRYGFALPMDDCRAIVLLDLGGRAELVWDVRFTREYVGDIPTEMFRHFFQSLSSAMKANIYVQARGDNNHHLAEAVFKAFARALKAAVHRQPFNYDLPSSKGLL